MEAAAKAAELAVIAEGQPETEPAEGQPPKPQEPDTRSPYERFRARKKRLTVTDLVSNLWCEQQYQYTLERGFKRRTPQMERGTKVHRKLEEQVHTVVPVEIKTPEDQWGLKLFNMCQGLTSLKDTGLTRELSVFGFVQGMFVHGIIDEVSYTGPQAKVVPVEQVILPSQASGEKKRDEPTEDEDQLTIEDLLPQTKPSGTQERTVYLLDTKTRASKSLPRSSAVQATALQLMLYHHLFSLLRAGEVDFAKVLEHHSLDGSKSFTDGFVATIAGLDSLMSLEQILEHNSLWGMWTYMQRQMKESVDSLGENMGVSYRSQADGAVIGVQTFQRDSTLLKEHLDTVIKWWKGERETVGVEIEDAWKCMSPSLLPKSYKAHTTWRRPNM